MHSPRGGMPAITAGLVSRLPDGSRQAGNRGVRSNREDAACVSTNAQSVRFCSVTLEAAVVRLSWIVNQRDRRLRQWRRRFGRLEIEAWLATRFGRNYCGTCDCQNQEDQRCAT